MKLRKARIFRYKRYYGYGLNVCVPPAFMLQSSVGILTPNTTVLGGGNEVMRD